MGLPHLYLVHQGGRSPLGKHPCHAWMRPGINKRKSGDEASFHRLQVCLEPLLLQIKFPFYLTQHFIVDAPPVAQSDNGSSLGCEHLLAKTELGRKAITVLVVCGSNSFSRLV